MLFLSGNDLRVRLIREVIELNKICAGLKGPRSVLDIRGSIHGGRLRRAMSTWSGIRRRCLGSGCIPLIGIT
eukprot:2542309-Pyramimonas_sp.AAC.1